MSDQNKNKSEQNQNSPIPDLPAKQMKVESEAKKSNEHHSAEGQKIVRNDVDSHEDSFIGQYKVVKTIGKGNFAKVKLAQHVITKRNVAIKIMDKTKMNPSGLHKLMREVRIMKMLDHPNIVKLYEVMESETMLYIVIEYCEGGEVFDYLVSHGRMKEKEARDKFRQILSAVQYCHRLFVIHRDLKAENLLLDSHLNIKIADFGFSNQYHPEKKLETFCGSPPYAAPELFLGQKYIGPEVDIWSLGVILFTLVSGSLPFDGQNIKELRAKVLKGVFRIPFFMSTTCECLIRRMLVIDTNKRIKLDEVMEDEWVNDGMPPLKPYQSPPPCYDEKRIQTLLSMGFTSEEITRSLRDKRYDPVMATYMLLDTTTCGPDDYMKYRCEPTQVSNMDTRIRSSFYDRHDIKPERHSPCTPTRDQYSSSYTKPRQRPTTVADAMSSHRTRQSQIPHSRRYTFFVEPTYNKGENIEKEAIKRHSIPTGIKNNPQSDREQQGFTKEGNRLDVYNLISSPKKIGYLSESPSQDSPKVRKGFIERLSDRLRRTSFSSKTPPPNAEEFIDIPFNSPNRPATNYNPNDYPGQNTNEQSDSVEDPSTPIINESIHQLPEPRSLRFTWNFRTTSSKSPADILLEINRVLLMYRIEFQQIDSFTFQCFYDFSKSQGTSSDHRRLSLEYPSFKNSSPVTPPKSLAEGGGGSNHGTEEIVPRKNNLSYVVNRSVQWEVEVCKLPLLFMNAVRFKRISGETFLYKIIVSQITDELKL